MGFKEQASQIHKVNAIFCGIRIMFAIIIIGVCASIATSTLRDDEGFDYSIAGYAINLVQYLGVAAGVAIIFVEILGLLSFFLWSRWLHITFIVIASLLVVFSLASSIVTAIPIVAVSQECETIETQCYICSDSLRKSLCELNSEEAGKECWVYESTNKYICDTSLRGMEGGLVLLILLGALELVAAVLGCAGANEVGRKQEFHFPLLDRAGSSSSPTPKNLIPK